jgi:TRAP-type C4-dicarboxylate transport system permease small subunit
LDLIIACIALIVLTLITVAGVFKRYVVKDPILWQEEISSFCQVWMVYMGASVGFRAGSHVAIEMLVDAIPKSMQKFMGYVIDMIVLFVLVFLLVKSQAYVAQVFGRSGRPTPILRIPYTYLYGVAPYGCGLMIISYFVSKYAPMFTKSIDVPESEADEE